MSVPHPSPARSDGLPARWFLAFVLFATFVAFVDLGGRSLHSMDTPRGAAVARNMIRSGDWILPTLDGELYANKPPLYFWLVAAASTVRGEVTAWTARLPSALALILLAFSTVGWARSRTGRDGTALLAGLLLLSTGHVVWLAREARLDMLGAALCVLGTWLWDDAASGRGTRRTPWLAGLALGGALLVKGPPLLLLPLLVLFLGGPLSDLGARLRRGKPWIVLGVAIVLALAWLLPAWRAGGDAWLRALVVDQTAERVSGRGNHLQAWWFYLVWMPASMAPWGPAYLALAVLALVPRVRRRLGPVGGPLLAVAVSLVVFSIVPTKHTRYVVPLAPALAMGLAWTALRLLSGRAEVPGPLGPRGRRPTAVALLLLALGVAVFALLGEHPPVGALVAAAGIAAGALLLLRGEYPEGVPPWEAALRRLTFALALVVVAFAASRHRAEVRPRVRLQQGLAREVAPGEPVLVYAPSRSEDVFEGAPHARRVRASDPDERPPAGRHVVVCYAEQIAEVEAWEGTPGRVIVPLADTEGWAALRFGPTPW